MDGKFLSDRSQVVRVGSCESAVITLQFGVPQGSVLGPKRFLEYAENVCPLLKRLQYHLFADDMQGLKHGSPTDVPQIASTLADCATDVIAWCAAERLQLNADKTEVMWFGSAANISKIPLANRNIRHRHCSLGLRASGNLPVSYVLTGNLPPINYR